MLATDLLLALDGERGAVLSQASIGLDYGLAGAITMDLALRACLRVEDDRVVTTGTTVDDVLLDDALRVIAATPGKKLAYWIQHLPREVGGLRQRLLDRLVAQGALEKREKRVLLLFHQKVHPERDARVEHDIRARLDGVLLQGQSSDAATTCLIHLLRGVPRHRRHLSEVRTQGHQGAHRRTRCCRQRRCQRSRRCGCASRSSRRFRSNDGRDHGVDDRRHQRRDRGGVFDQHSSLSLRGSNLVVQAG